MKKIILSFGLFLSLMACSEKTSIDYALLTGKIENIDTKVITINKEGQPLKKEIVVKPDGTFIDTIKTKPGFYLVNVGRNKALVYLDAGNKINLTVDNKDFYGSLKFSGEGSEITNYVKFKNKKIAELKGKSAEFYALEEVEFKKKVKNIRETLSNVIDTIKGIKPEFKALEKKGFDYNYLLDLSKYASGYHKARVNNPNYKASKEFLAEFDTLNLNNEVEFKRSSLYKQLVVNYYVNEIRDLSEKDSIDFMVAKVKVHSKIPNEYIKNELLFSGAEYAMIKIENFEEYYQTFISASTNESNNAKITAVYNKLSKLNRGQVSPKFFNYENNAGGTLSLDDLKGKYTYIDLWATWCAPCLAQVPFLKKIEKAYHGKNINFLSISIDNPKDHDKWKKMIADKDLGGIQVIADKSTKSQFAQEYFITSIPRFILIDPNGLIIDKKAPLPSNPELIELFNELNI
ncbi:TlpA family protein disulfide reductase [Polaribacter sargassicola]|uniref:TlpA family protein disulfide reductase n=1 Tax=Polaribacter sargassicola TaxID=2836891 RepID=UPI001F364BB4|nr:TlpA disulfide reductase family protein [Polaribacter sp. DS7-9]MCG1037307.1 TlpA family protein disulfide reductase [Polaribacter sp. DS7-9]